MIDLILLINGVDERLPLYRQGFLYSGALHADGQFTAWRDGRTVGTDPVKLFKTHCFFQGMGMVGPAVVTGDDVVWVGHAWGGEGEWKCPDLP